MKTERQMTEEAQDSSSGELDVRREDGRYLPKTLDPVITMAAVQRYVESERYRSRRALLWTVGVFTVVLLGVVAAFVAVGTVVLQSNRKTVAIVDDVSRRTTTYANEMADVASRVGMVQESHRRVQAAVEAGESDRHKESSVLKYDLERFSRWIAEGQQRDSGQIQAMQEQVRKMDRIAAERESELAGLRKQQAELQELFRMAGQAAAVRAEARPGGQGDVVTATVAVVRQPAAPPEQRDIRVMNLPSGDRYEGEFRNGLFNGWGVYAYKNGDRYEGEFADDQKDGKGTFTGANGDKYVGEFAKDRKHGQGTLFFKNGDRFVGAFENDCFQGSGTMAYQNGNRYVGEFNRGQKHGTGTFTYANGDRYEGSFQNDERTGQGTYAFKDGAVYVGSFKSGRRHGNGRYHYATGEEYIGEFRDGKKEGVGECVYPGGVKVKGLWKDDKFVGASVE
jgi:hypothetical protein